MKPLEGKRPTIRAVLLVIAGMVIVAVTLFRVPLATVFALGVLLICPLLMVGIHGGRHADGHTTSGEVPTGPSDRAGVGGKAPSLPASRPQDRDIDRSANDQRREVPL